MPTNACSITDCTRPIEAKGWCQSHYRRWRLHGDPHAGRVYTGPSGGPCSVDGCSLPSMSRGMCENHYRRFKAHGDPTAGRIFTGLTVGAPCSVDGCELPSESRGLCAKHYARHARYGDPLGGFRQDKVQRLRRGATPIERVLSKIVIDIVTGCWVWQANKIAKGYGRFSVDGRPKLVHLFVYELYVGPVPDGYEVDHLCRNTSCCNPDHLEAVPPEENIRRRVAARTECNAGHAYADHAYLDTAGRRRCRICTKERARRYRAKKALRESR